MTTAQELTQRAADLKKIIDAFRPTQGPTSGWPGHEICPDFVRLQTEVMWGGIWMGPGLDLKLRSLATVCAQCVNGWDFGLHHQIRTSLTLGVSPQKIKGIFIELLFYVGIPATVFGFLAAQEIIDQADAIFGK